MKQIIKNNNIKKFLYIALAIVSILLSLQIRNIFLSIQSADYIMFLEKWYTEIKENGGFLALKNEIGNYNIPYLVIMAGLTYIPKNPLFLIKAISIIFDYIMAIVSALIVFELCNKSKRKNKIISYICTFIIIIFLPTVILNSSAWAQCDSIYTAFVLLSLLFIIKEKYINSFIFLGIAFAFKLQTIFILPVFLLIYISDRRFSIFNFLIIPIVNVIMCIPALIVGRSLLSCLSIYTDQTGTYAGYISLNFPSVYSIFLKPIEGSNLIENTIPILSYIGIIFAIVVFIVISAIVFLKKLKLNSKIIINISLWSIMICTFFLPSMHDRYMYMADVISIIFYVVNRKKVYIPIAINVCSLYTYLVYLYNKMYVPICYVAIVYGVVVFIYSYDIIISMLKQKDFTTDKENKKELQS